nr:alpha-amylase/trypsin inhibitor-like [Oryza sativa Japonica Group]
MAKVGEQQPALDLREKMASAVAGLIVLERHPQNIRRIRSTIVSRNLLLSVSILLSILPAAASAGMYCKPGMAIGRSRTTNRSGADCLQCMHCSRRWFALQRGDHVELSGAFEGRLLEDFPGCPREMQRGLAAMLINPGECNLKTIHGGPCCLELTRTHQLIIQRTDFIWMKL